MHATCKCLNVSIRSKGNELKRLPIDEIELTDHERADAFFREVGLRLYFFIIHCKIYRTVNLSSLHIYSCY